LLGLESRAIDAEATMDGVDTHLRPIEAVTSYSASLAVMAWLAGVCGGIS